MKRMVWSRTTCGSAARRATSAVRCVAADALGREAVHPGEETGSVTNNRRRDLLLFVETWIENRVAASRSAGGCAATRPATAPRSPAAPPRPVAVARGRRPSRARPACRSRESPLPCRRAVLTGRRGAPVRSLEINRAEEAKLDHPLPSFTRRAGLASFQTNLPHEIPKSRVGTRYGIPWTCLGVHDREFVLRIECL
jgi:hypothetical protein